MTGLASNICKITFVCFFLQNNVKNASHTVDATCTDTCEHSDDETALCGDVILTPAKKKKN